MWRTFYRTDPATCLRIFTRYWVVGWKPIIATAIPAACIGAGLLMLPALPVPPIPPGAAPIYAPFPIPISGLGMPYGGGGGGFGGGGYGIGGGGGNFLSGGFVPLAPSNGVPLFTEVFLPGASGVSNVQTASDVPEPSGLAVIGLALIAWRISPRNAKRTPMREPRRA